MKADMEFALQKFVCNLSVFVDHFARARYEIAEVCWWDMIGPVRTCLFLTLGAVLFFIARFANTEPRIFLDFIHAALFAKRNSSSAVRFGLIASVCICLFFGVERRPIPRVFTVSKRILFP